MSFPKDWQLNPLEGAGPVRFGMTYDQVVSVLGEPDQAPFARWRSTAKTAGWHKIGFAIEFNPEVVHIEFFRRNSDLVVKVDGVDVDLFRTPASEVVDAFVECGHSFEGAGRRFSEDPKLGHSYVFKDLQVAFWRQVVREDDHDEDGKYFETVSLAAPRYYA
jgi:hypothetical protein